mgnify:CR=1 FL=1
MIAPIDVQFIAGKDGVPEYAIIPFKAFQTLCNHKVREFNEKETIPHEVIKKMHLEDMNAIQAWREYLNLTQAEVAIKAKIGAGVGSLGPVNLNIPVIIDRSVAIMSDFSAGANIDGKHYFNINWERDVALPKVADIRNVVEGDPSPDGKGTLLIKRGIEVGHIFQLGDKYSNDECDSAR